MMGAAQSSKTKKTPLSLRSEHSVPKTAKRGQDIRAESPDKGRSLIFRSVGSMGAVDAYEKVEHGAKLTRCDGSKESVHEDRHVALHATYDVCTGQVHGEYNARQARCDDRKTLPLAPTRSQGQRKGTVEFSVVMSIGNRS